MANVPSNGSFGIFFLSIFLFQFRHFTYIIGSFFPRRNKGDGAGFLFTDALSYTTGELSSALFSFWDVLVSLCPL